MKVLLFIISIIFIFNPSYINADQGVVKFDSFLSDGVIKFIIISDLEGDSYQIQESLKVIRRHMDLDCIIIAGDLYENEELRYNPLFIHKKDNVMEMMQNLLPYASLNIPVFIIAGNHEERLVYDEALSRLHSTGYGNLIDLNRKGIDFKGINLIGLGGYHNTSIMPETGIRIYDKDYEEVLNLIKSFQVQNEVTLFITHGPPWTGNSFLDYLPEYGYVGDKKISEILNHKGFKNIYHLHGHLHERSGMSARFASAISVNVSGITSYNNTKSSFGGLVFTITKDGDVSLSQLNN